MDRTESTPPRSPLPPAPAAPSSARLILTLREQYPGWRPSDDDHSSLAVAWRAERGVRLGEENRDALHEIRTGLGELRDVAAEWGSRADAAVASWRGARKWLGLAVAGMLLAHYGPRLINWISTLHH